MENLENESLKYSESDLIVTNPTPNTSFFNARIAALALVSTLGAYCGGRTPVGNVEDGAVIDAGVDNIVVDASADSDVETDSTGAGDVGADADVAVDSVEVGDLSVDSGDGNGAINSGLDWDPVGQCFRFSADLRDRIDNVLADFHKGIDDGVVLDSEMADVFTIDGPDWGGHFDFFIPPRFVYASDTPPYDWNGRVYTGGVVHSVLSEAQVDELQACGVDSEHAYDHQCSNPSRFYMTNTHLNMSGHRDYSSSFFTLNLDFFHTTAGGFHNCVSRSYISNNGEVLQGTGEICNDECTTVISGVKAVVARYEPFLVESGR